MFQTIISWFLGSGLNTVGNIIAQIVEAKKDKINAVTAQEQIAADERIKALEAKRDVLIQGTKTPADVAARTLLMTPVAVILWKVLIWDYTLD